MKASLIFFFMIFTLVSCGDNGNPIELKSSIEIGEAGTRSLKPLFSSWTSFSRTRPILNLRGGDFSRTLSLAIDLDVLVTCECLVFITGNESSGSMNFSSCFSRAGNSEVIDCRSLEGFISYNKSNAQLNLNCINKPVCGTYR